MNDAKTLVDGQMPSALVLTIVITCYNTRDLVRDCLNSIFEHLSWTPDLGPLAKV